MTIYTRKGYCLVKLSSNNKAVEKSDCYIHTTKTTTKMRHLFIRFCKSLLKLEHIIYCATNCKVEFLLHKKYYEHRRKKYDSYIQEKNYLQSISSKI